MKLFSNKTNKEAIINLKNKFINEAKTIEKTNSEVLKLGVTGIKETKNLLEQFL